MNNVSLSVQFFLQIAVILLACQVVGTIAARFGQPQDERQRRTSPGFD